MSEPNCASTLEEAFEAYTGPGIRRLSLSFRNYQPHALYGSTFITPGPSAFLSQRIRNPVFMTRILFFTCLFLTAFLYPAAAQHADSLNAAALEKLEARAYDEAIPLLRQAARAGHVEAQYNLGIALTEGIGITADPEEANRWLRKAAEQDWPDAQYKLAYSYTLGRGVEKDLAQAFSWFEKAAGNGDIEAHFIVIGMLMEGQGIPVDVPKAIAWAEDLAVKENPNDIRLSGQITSARLNLARLYLNGEQGLSRDPLQAYVWLLITNESKSDFSTLYQQQIIDDIHTLEDELVESDLSRARELAESTLGRPLENLENRHSQEM